MKCKAVFFLLFIVSTTVSAQLGSTPFRIVVLGSSTAEGDGASSLSKSWVALYTKALTRIDKNFKVFNLARWGYSTMHLCPTGYRYQGQTVLPDSERNITKALSLAPDAIIINLPANDLVLKVPLEVQQKNFDIIVTTALQDSVPVWVTTVQPRNNLTEQELKYQLAMRDWILAHYGDKAIDLWKDLVNKDGGLKPEYAYKDGAHLNDNGHELLFKIINGKNIPKALEDALVKIKEIDTTSLDQGWEFEIETTYEKGLNQFILERNDGNDSAWIKIASTKAYGNSSVPRFYSLTDTSSFSAEKYYRINILNNKKKGTTNIYTKIIAVGKGTKKYTLYPNPSRDLFWIRGLSIEKHLLEIFDISGRLVLRDDNYFPYNYISLAGLPTGIYFINLDNRKTALKAVKI